MNLNCDAIQSKTEANDFFSTLNKDITLIQTNKIKSNYLESIGNDMYQKFFFYIEEHNISYIKKAIDDRLSIARSTTKTQSPNVQDPMLTTVQTARKGTGKGHRKNGLTTIYYEND